MKQLLKNIVSCLLALLVLLSTVSFTIDKHYCGGKLVSRSILKEADTCGMVMQLEIATTSSCKVVKKNCCKNEHQLVKGQNELQQSYVDMSFVQQAILTSFAYYYLNLFEGLENNIIPFKGYRPSLVVKPIYKIDQVYLI